MSRCRMKFISVLLGTVLAALSVGAWALELAQQSSQQHGVTVRAKPLVVATDAKSWTFELVLDTHSQDLSDDLARAVTLIDDSGRQHTPLAWDGAAPGGHHRKGVLSFKPLKPAPAAIELRLQRPGEAVARSFRWQLK